MKTFIVLFSLLPMLSWSQTQGQQSASASFSLLPALKTTAAAIIHNDQEMTFQPFLARTEMMPADSLPPAPKAQKHKRLRNFYIPLTLVAAGFSGTGREPLITYNAEIHEEIQEHYSGFKTKMDNYTRHVPIVTVFGLNLAGIKGRHDLYNLTAIYLLSNFINSSATSKLKKLTHQLRPDLSSADAFPSGHTSGAFMEATILFREYKDQSIWYGIAGYGVAAATGGLRMLNNKHWFSDVLAGAGVGILSTQVAYAVYPWIQKKISQGIPRTSGHQLMILPRYAFHTPEVSFLYIIK